MNEFSADFQHNSEKYFTEYHGKGVRSVKGVIRDPEGILVLSSQLSQHVSFT